MDPRVWVWARWPTAILGLAIVAALAAPAAWRAILGSVEFNTATGREAAPGSPAGGTLATGPVTDGVSPPLADFVARGGTVAEAQAPELVLDDQPGTAIVMAFPVIPGNPACIAGVFVDLTIRQASATELSSFLATSWDAPALLDGAPVPQQLFAAPEPSARAFTDGTPGRLRWDVTGDYRLFLTSGVAPADAPFVAAVSATSTLEPGGGVRVAAAEAGPDGPALSWTGVPGCEATA